MVKNRNKSSKAVSKPLKRKANYTISVYILFNFLFLLILIS